MTVKGLVEEFFGELGVFETKSCRLGCHSRRRHSYSP